MTALIICNGTIENYDPYKKYIEQANIIICADGGAAHARRLGVIPHILLGDFDSIRKEDLEYFSEKGVEIVRLPVEKDLTDTEFAIDLAVNRGYKTIILMGAIGSRLDHSMANIFLLKGLLEKGIKGIIVNESNEITAIDQKIELYREEGIHISLLPLTEKAEGVTTRGLYYPLNQATIPLGSTRGVSNEFSANTAEVTLEKGMLLVIKSKD